MIFNPNATPTLAQSLRGIYHDLGVSFERLSREQRAHIPLLLTLLNYLKRACARWEKVLEHSHITPQLGKWKSSISSSGGSFY